MKRLNAIAVLAMMIIGLTTGLAACGGDDEDDPVAPKVTISTGTVRNVEVENCRFHDLVRWSKQGKVDLNEIFNTRYGGIHERIPTVRDEYEAEYDKETGEFIRCIKPHKLYVTYTKAIYEKFQVGKHEYFPFPFEVKNGNPNLKDVLGWEYLNTNTAE